MRIDLQVESIDGEDQLNPNSGTIHAPSIRLHHLVEGELVYNGNKNLRFVEGASQYAIRVSALSPLNYGLQTMYITWTYLDVDTLDVELSADETYTFATKFWFNGIKVYEGTNYDLPIHTIIK